MIESFVVMGITLQATEEQITTAFNHYMSYQQHTSYMQDMKEAWRAAGIVIS